MDEQKANDSVVIAATRASEALAFDSAACLELKGFAE